jgi:hypothetical protein
MGYMNMYRRYCVDSFVSAIVANDGSSVVTFDNWLISEYGANVIVING